MVKLAIREVDYSPPELEGHVPFEVTLLRELPGPDRPDYWLASLARPLQLPDGAEVTHLVLVARWVGTAIGPGLRHDLPVVIAYVTDQTLLDDARLALEKCDYVAIGWWSMRRPPAVRRSSHCRKRSVCGT